LREAEVKLRAFLQSASQGVIAIDVTGRIDLTNPKAEELFGYRREELLGQTLEMLLPERYRGAHIGHRAEYFSQPRPRPMGLGLDLAGRRKDGTEFPVEIALSFVPTEGGPLPLAIAFINDITERKRTEETLRRTQKLESLGVLAGGVAHDFNNLLTTIMGNATLALQAMRSTSPDRLLIEEIIQASKTAADLRSDVDPQEGSTPAEPRQQAASGSSRCLADSTGRDEPGHQRRRGDWRACRNHTADYRTAGGG
jgi:PAS domain S-box-containing protein